MNIINLNDKSGKLYYVGGVVRDFLLGVESRDIDMVYEGLGVSGQELAELLAPNSLSLSVIQENPDFGTIRVVIDGREVDIASTRAETYPKPGHLPVVHTLGCSLKEDVLRRDFTINALAMRVCDGEIIDYAGGVEDLKNKKLRVLHDRSFIDDPTRIIRGLKFADRFGFELEEHTKYLQDEYLTNVNYDMCYKRIKQELADIFDLDAREDARLSGQAVFERFINDGVYKLITPNEVKLPGVNIENLINQYSDYQHLPSGWIVYIGVLRDLSRFELTRAEKKMLEDYGSPKTDFEIYKAFENAPLEAILLHAVLKDEKAARRYLDVLRRIKIEITGNDLNALGLSPSPRYAEILDYVLKEKLKNPGMTKEDELNHVSLFLPN